MSKQSKIESYPELEAALVNIYNEALPLFRAVPQQCGDFVDMPVARIGKPAENPREGESVAFFTFEGEIRVQGFNTIKVTNDIGTDMSVNTERLDMNRPTYVSEIIVNTNSIYFDDYLNELKGFELTVLHEMLHIKNDTLSHINYEFDHTHDFDYITACHLIAETYPLSLKGKPPFICTWRRGGTNLWACGEGIEKKEVHGIRFMTLCYYLAKALLTKKRILQTVLNGREVKGSNTWEKRKWLAIRIFQEDDLEYYEKLDRYYKKVGRKFKDDL